MSAHADPPNERTIEIVTADRLFQALTQASRFGVVVLDRERRVRFANDIAVKTMQRPLKDSVGYRLDELHPVVGRELDAILARVIETGKPALRVGLKSDLGQLDFDAIPAMGPGGVDHVVLVLTMPGNAPERPGSFLRDRTTLIELTSRLARMTSVNADKELNDLLALIADEYNVDRAYVRLLSEDGRLTQVTHHYDAPGLPELSNDGSEDLTTSGSVLERYQRGETITVESLKGLAPDDPIRVALERAGASSVCSVPILDGTRLLGRLSFVTSSDRLWPEIATSRLRVFGEMFGIAVSRLRADEALRERLDFEQAMASMFARLVDARPADFDAEMTGALMAIAAMLHLDRTVISLLDDARERFVVTYEWSAPGLTTFKSAVTGVSIATFGWPLVNVLRGETMNLTRDEVPENATYAKTVLDRAAVRAMAMIPLSVNGDIIGHLLFQSVTRKARIPQDLIARLHVVGGVIASTLARRRADESLRESESRFTQVIESALDGVVVVDAGGVIVEWTPQSEHLFGRRRHEVVGRRFGELAIDAKDRERFAAARAKTESGGARLEVTGTHRDGHAFPVELSFAPMKRGGAEICALFVRDITERKRAEQERQRAFDEVARLKATAERERDYLREEVGTDGGQTAIFGQSPTIRRALESLDAVATTNAAVLVHGESGVGKELFARAVHSRSRRASEALVKVNCASIPESLFESEFFGHVRGSFTGAHKDRVGRFELADGGTMFLDEVGEIPLEMQAKLLRVLQEGEFERVGDDRTRKVDVRIVAATNRDLAAEVQAGRFRRDLYYRLSVFPIEIPPLRDRTEDIAPLAQLFLRTMARTAGRTGLELTAAHKTMLCEYDWPGNIRELQHVIERAVILSPQPPLQLQLALASPHSQSVGQSQPRMRASESAILTDDELRKLERDNLVAALDKASGRISGDGGAAEILKVNPSTLRDRMKALGIARRS